MDFKTEKYTLTPALRTYIKNDMPQFCEGDVLNAIKIYSKNFLKETVPCKDVSIDGFKLNLRFKRLNSFNVLVGFQSSSYYMSEKDSQ